MLSLRLTLKATADMLLVLGEASARLGNSAGCSRSNEDTNGHVWGKCGSGSKEAFEAPICAICWRDSRAFLAGPLPADVKGGLHCCLRSSA